MCCRPLLLTLDQGVGRKREINAISLLMDELSCLAMPIGTRVIGEGFLLIAFDLSRMLITV